ncbi:hypothetical protein F4553_001793 [Allocatelliglobosispora scoriae]|uniref:Uncharacterized protein n=1 Tax=Allocatelliglobosispora scoriae TaxID=643052 RepID=A0A841BJI2_9ACTN|nr:hypothetical protein [Allocatelliglobosispora scoriae]MBB5868414.1 hypothetical protein [Allocatelliglobosispora scoriae]
MDGKVYAALFDRVYDVMKAAASSVKVGTAAMGYQWAPKKNDPNHSIAGHTDHPDDWHVKTADFLGVDAYSGQSFPLATILPEHPGVTRWLQHIVPAHGEYALIERGFKATGSTERLERAKQIAREADWLLTTEGRRCTTYIYWDTPGQESDAALVLGDVGEAALADLQIRMLHATSTPTIPQQPTQPTKPNADYQRGYAEGYAAGLAKVDKLVTDLMKAPVPVGTA